MNREKIRYWKHQILGAVTFTLGIIACYQGAIQRITWLGIAVVLLIMAYELLNQKKYAIQKLKLFVFVAILGSIVESIMIMSSVYSVESQTRIIHTLPFIPIWIFALWVNFAIRVPSYLSICRNKHILNGIIGFAFAFLIFRSAAQLELIELTYKIYSILIVGIAWGITIPIIYIYADRVFSSIKNTN